MGEPTAGLSLLIRNDRTANAVGPDAVTMGDLLGHFHNRTGDKLLVKFILHGRDYSGGEQSSPYDDLAFINSFHKCDIASGTTRTSPTAVMKFVSPPHRGTTC